jgi:hypothetical protein
MQYTIRGIPPALDEALRTRARSEGKSLNEAAVDALARGAGFSDGTVGAVRDLSDVAGTWKAEAAVEKALSEQDQVDEALWK